MAAGSISDRLRQLKEQNGWTAQEMADRIGMSRRTLESYMRREKAPQPGLEALKQIATGTLVSLDWLVLGDAHSRLSGVLLVRLAAERAALPVLTNLYESNRRKEPVPEPEYLAHEIGAQAAEKADFIIESGATSVQIAQLLGLSRSSFERTMKSKVADLRSQIEGLNLPDSSKD